jgi:phage shock protein PspC (stress-responsive transcriptional regulator)
MKKTITINLSGVIFHIDEDAYHLLGQYLDSLRHHFAPDEGMAEIMTDIETRIAEILQKKVVEGRQVITIDDIREIMKIMGQPREIDSNGEHPGGDQSEGREPRRFYRDPDERMIAGVCSGIAAWLRMDPVWVRLIFILTVFLGGSGILIYLILWIVMPEARTTTDRLRMRGEPVTIRNIEQSIREEWDEVRKRMGEAAGRTKEQFRGTQRNPSPVDNLLKALGEVFTFLGKTLVVFIGILMLLIGISLLLAVLALTFGWGGAMGEIDGNLIMSAPGMARFILGCNMDIAFLEMVVLAVLGLPVVMLLYNGIRLTFRVEKIRYFTLTLFNIWIVALIILAYLGFKSYNLVRLDHHSQQEVKLANPSTDTLYIAFHRDDSLTGLLDEETFILPSDARVVRKPDSLYSIIPFFRYEEVSDSLVGVSIDRYARGKSRNEARSRTEGIIYPVSVSGDTLFISPVYRIPKRDCWRGEKITVHLQVPDSTKIVPLGRTREIIPDWYWN